MVNRKCLPSGRTDGQACVISPFSALSVVSGANVPPVSGIRIRGDLAVAGATIVPSGSHARPGADTSRRKTGGPPAGLTFISFQYASYVMKRPSGDQDGLTPPSVPGNSWTAVESS